MSDDNKESGRGKSKTKPRRWTDKEDQFVRDNIAHMTHAEIAEELGRSKLSVNGYCTRKKIRTPGAGQFKKGCEPFNKGMKPEEYMDEEGIENMRKTQFEKGHKPANTLFNGAITIRQDHPNRNGPAYMFIRLSKGKWEKYQRYLWEKKHGEIPSNKILVCKNRNTLNTNPENWELITRAENARRNADWRKAMQTMTENNNHPSRDLTDAYVATMLAGHDKEIKEFIINERPDLIRVARANYKLKREINNGS